MPSVVGLTTLATAAPSKTPASEVGLEEERAPKGPRRRTGRGAGRPPMRDPFQPPHHGHQAAVQTPLDDVPPVQDAVHGAGSRAQDSAAGFDPEADGEERDESQIFLYRQ